MAKNNAPQTPDSLAASELIAWFDQNKRIAMHNYRVLMESAEMLEKAMAKAPMDKSEARAKSRRVADFIRQAAEADRACALHLARANKAFQNEFEQVMNPRKKQSKRDIQWTM